KKEQKRPKQKGKKKQENDESDPEYKQEEDADDDEDEYEQEEEEEEEEDNKKRSTLKKSRTSQRTSPKKSQRKVVLLRTGVEDPKGENEKLENLGATILDNYSPIVTHLVSQIPRRTLKFIAGMAFAQYLFDFFFCCGCCLLVFRQKNAKQVTDDWVAECIKRKTLAVGLKKKKKKILQTHIEYEKDFFPCCLETKKVEQEYGFDMKESFEKAKEKKLFIGMSLFVAKEVEKDVQQALTIMFEAHGGRKLRSLCKKNPTDKNILVVANKAEDKSIKALLKQGWRVFNRNVVVTSILRQNINLADKELCNFMITSCLDLCLCCLDSSCDNELCLKITRKYLRFNVGTFFFSLLFSFRSYFKEKKIGNNVDQVSGRWNVIT
ncbi:hypothetical protein RFI_14057, partial [Reticulomyxa filosa]